MKALLTARIGRRSPLFSVRKGPLGQGARLKGRTATQRSKKGVRENANFWEGFWGSLFSD